MGAHRGGLCLALGRISGEAEEELLFGVQVLQSLGVLCRSPRPDTAPSSGSGRRLFETGLGPSPSGNHPLVSSCTLKMVRRPMLRCAVRASCGKAPGGTGSSNSVAENCSGAYIQLGRKFNILDQIMILLLN